MGVAVRCTKTKHKSKGAAEAHLRSLKARATDLKDPDALCTYLHAGCGWHVGHRPTIHNVRLGRVRSNR